jgi:uncharacterized protein (UPF0212 family)
MPKCPKCGAEIHALVVFEKVENEWIFDGDDYILTDKEFVDVGGFHCPACGELLFEDEMEASKFLKGGSRE